MEKAVVSLPTGFDGLVALVKILRSDHGCPWDREQTPEQIKICLLEEAYEVLAALESGDPKEVCAELGDLLFHIVFLARIFEEIGNFDMAQVVQVTTEKMIRRHPHVFGQTQISNSDEVRQQWHEIKMSEAKANHTVQGSPLSSVPRKLPALMRAYRLSERGAKLDADQPDVHSILQRMDERLAAFKASLEAAHSENLAEAFGDLLFTMVNLGRLVRIHPEAALRQTIEKFIERFETTQETVIK